MRRNTLRARLARTGLMVVLLALTTSRLVPAQVPRLPDGGLGGTVTAVTAEQATIRTIADEPFTIIFAPDTTFFKQVGASFKTVPAKVTDIKIGNSLNVTGHLGPDGITKHAKIVVILNAETSQKLLAHGGESTSQVAGMVQAINGTKLTIARYDQVSQVIEVTPDTVFFKGSSPAVITAQLFGAPSASGHAGLETTTLEGIKVGDILYTVGALKFPPTVPLKDNIFIASKVAVQSKPEPAGPDATPKQ